MDPDLITREAAHLADRREVEAFRKRLEDRDKIGWELSPLKPVKKPKAMKSTRVIVMGDSHAHPDIGNHRYEWAARLIADHKPDIVVDIGDSADMASLLHCDSPGSRPSFERIRYFEDIEVYIDAKTRLTRGIPKGTRLVKTNGNHEHRIERFCTWEPKLRGWIDMTDLRDAAMGWELIPFLTPIDIEGVQFCHYFKARGSGDRPISGVMPTRATIQKLPGSFHRVQGHSHAFQWYEQADGCGGKVTAMMAGCYFDPQSSAHDWAGADVDGWRAGLLELVICQRQIMDWRWISLETIRQEYA